MTSVIVDMQEEETQDHFDADVCLLDDLEDMLVCDDTDFIEVFDVLAVEVLEVEVTWWLVSLEDVEDGDEDVFVEVFVVLLAADFEVELVAGHSRGGAESYAVRIPFTAE